jgi:hypothetical protein
MQYSRDIKPLRNKCPISIEAPRPSKGFRAKAVKKNNTFRERIRKVT